MLFKHRGPPFGGPPEAADPYLLIEERRDAAALCLKLSQSDIFSNHLLFVKDSDFGWSSYLDPRP